MPPRFLPGAAAYSAKDGRRYVVDEVADGIVYCSSAGGGETEFSEAQMLNEAEWAAQNAGKRGNLYARLKQSRAYSAHKDRLDRKDAEQLLSKTERLMPGLLDFAAYTVASRVLRESGDQNFVADLSIVKCREVFDTATPEIRAALLAGLLGTPPATLVSANRLGDNLMRAMLDKGLGVNAEAFEEFGSRRRQ